VLDAWDEARLADQVKDDREHDQCNHRGDPSNVVRANALIDNRGDLVARGMVADLVEGHSAAQELIIRTRHRKQFYLPGVRNVPEALVQSI